MQEARDAAQKMLEAGGASMDYAKSESTVSGNCGTDKSYTKASP